MQTIKQEFDSQVKQCDEASLLQKTTKTFNFQNNQNAIQINTLNKSSFNFKNNQNAIQINTIYFVYFSVPSLRFFDKRLVHKSSFFLKQRII